MRSWLIWSGAAAIGLTLTVVIVGYLLPVRHVAAADALVEEAPEAVYALIADVKRHPQWRPDVSRVEVLAETPHTRWKENGSGGEITLELVEAVRPVRLKTRIADPSLPFGGTWTFELSPSGSGTRVKITENGEVYNPIFRFMSRFVFGHTATIERYLDALRRARRS